VAASTIIAGVAAARRQGLTASDTFVISFCYASRRTLRPARVDGGPTMSTLARNGGFWIALGTGAGAAVGVALGIASVGLALGLALGILGSCLARR
jgi:hypothetical protein